MNQNVRSGGLTMESSALTVHLKGMQRRLFGFSSRGIFCED
jgi:hypothetical protein